jgi:hypothetical protein
MLKALLCSWLLAPCVALGATWTGTVTVGTATAKLVIQIDPGGCYVFIAEPVTVNARCTITEASATKLAFYTRTPETDWLGQVHGTTVSGDFVADHRLLDEAGSDKGLFMVKLEGAPAPAPSVERGTSAAPEARPLSDGVIVWRNGDKRIYQQGFEYEQLDADGVTVAVNLQPSGSWLVATVLVSNESSRDIDVLPGRFSAEFVGTGQRSVPVTPSPAPVDGLAIRLRTANLLNTCNSYAVQQDSAGLDRCRERVRRQIQQEQQQVVDANERLRRTALVATTVSPGGNVVGYVYFGSRHGEINLELPVGDTVFRFPFFF